MSNNRDNNEGKKTNRVLNFREKRNNMIKLVQGITNEFDTEFGMDCYAITEGGTSLNPEAVANECGTICCFAGHAPLLGIGAGKKFLGWSSFLYNELGISDTSKDYDFLFEQEWENDRKQAQARGYAYLTETGAYLDWLDEHILDDDGENVRNGLFDHTFYEPTEAELKALK